MKVQKPMTITKNYEMVAQVGYADLGYIMYGREPQYYNAGTFGWNNDMYDFNDLIICTGYRNLRGKKVPHSLLKEYSEKAHNIISSHIVYSEMKEELTFNLEAFLTEVKALFE